jgi:hypothetical protein
MCFDVTTYEFVEFIKNEKWHQIIKYLHIILISLFSKLTYASHTFPVAFPLAWQSSLQVDSAAHRANSVGLRKAVSHSQSNKPSLLITFFMIIIILKTS